MERVRQLGSDTGEIADAISGIVRPGKATTPDRSGRLLRLVTAAIWLGIVSIAFFGSYDLAKDRQVDRVRSRLTVPPVRRKPPVVQSYYAQIPPSPDIRPRKPKLHKSAPPANLVETAPPAVAAGAIPYKNGEPARHLTGDALRQAMIADQAITIQANIDARSASATNRPNPNDPER